jgi:hypothetical protein
MALKLLLVAFTTARDVEVGGKTEKRRVRFGAQKVVDLTEDELELLDRLTKATGKIHYREPISEGGKAAAPEPEIVDVPDYEGQDVAIASKSVPQLKAYLTFHEVEFASGANKSDLLALAEDHVANQGGAMAGSDNDPDSGL